MLAQVKEYVKTNKKSLIKGAAITGGVIAAVAIVATAAVVIRNANAVEKVAEGVGEAVLESVETVVETVA